ncbi:hypothetical protein LR48_Vigan07g284900 [Vigna angularis]|uniref:glucose-1-phosphate adenylyltransferase n=1 Tax=Phaseolus angularis TaxID=3914 RepID=A0A0L9V1Z2_PHAAN|nr:hypothetical protein LR48_Vigan07g284900 [Vigna angularis]
MMNATIATSDASLIANKGFGIKRTSFWGESTKGNLNVRFPNTKPWKSFKAACSKSGIARAVYTDLDQEYPALERSAFQSPKANPENVAAIILGGGAGTRLFPLTRTRAKPAVPIGGSYRLIDIPMSNCINSGIRKVYVLTQFNSCSLNAHLSRTYNFGNGVNFGGGFVEDAKNKNIENIMIISGDHLCRMDYMQLVEKHSENNADITVSCVPMDESGASDHGLMKIDRKGMITEFAYMFKNYWKDIGTIKSFFEANLALTEQTPRFEFYDQKRPFFTSPRNNPPTRAIKCRIVDAIISHGCYLNHCKVQHSIVGLRSRLEAGSELQDTMMMGADSYQTDSEIATLLETGKVPIGVGENTKIRKCIIDKNAKIGRNVIIANADGVEEADRPEEGFYIRSGIVVVVKNATIKHGTVI